MGEAVVWMRAHLSAPMAPVCFATDARGPEGGDCGAFGIVGADIEASTLRRYAEESMCPGASITRLDGAYTGDRRQEEPWRARKPLSRLPAELFALPPETWEPISWGKWKYSDHITLGETRTVVKLSQILSAQVKAHGWKSLGLQDNMPCSAALTKGRSPSPSLNHLARRQAGYCLGGDIGMLLPRVETYHQPADALSRLV